MAEKRVTRSMTRRHGMPMIEDQEDGYTADHNDPRAHTRVGPKSHRHKRFQRRSRKNNRHPQFKIRYNRADPYTLRARRLREATFAKKRKTIQALLAEQKKQARVRVRPPPAPTTNATNAIHSSSNGEYYRALRREQGFPNRDMDDL